MKTCGECGQGIETLTHWCSIACKNKALDRKFPPMICKTCGQRFARFEIRGIDMREYCSVNCGLVDNPRFLNKPWEPCEAIGEELSGKIIEDDGL